MKSFCIIIIVLAFISGCAVAGHGGAITRDGGLESSCAGGCAEYKAAGSGGAEVQDSTYRSCVNVLQEPVVTLPEQVKTKARISR